MSRAYTYQDPVHGAIEFPGDKLNSLIRKLIDCPEVQRLRHIRQNGLANLVFLGMEHSRFTHSLGVAYVARRMYDRIINNSGVSHSDEQKLHTVVAALLHDVGHGPFSHTLEEILNSIRKPFSHERMTVRILEGETKVNQLLSQYDGDLPWQLSTFIDKSRRSQDHWTYKIVSSQIDADRLDYLKRDAQQAGLVDTTFDLTRLLTMLTCHQDVKGNLSLLAVDRHAIEAVESYLLALDHMYRAVYFHKTVRAATVLLTSIIARAIDLFLNNNDQSVFPSTPDGRLHPLAQLAEQGDDIPVEDYLRLGEQHIWCLVDQWRGHKDRILQELAEKLAVRELPKTIEFNGYARGKNLRAKAGEILLQKRSDLQEADLKYYIAVDEVSRTSYKPYNWGQGGSDESIWMIGQELPAQPLEQDTSSKIILAIRDKHYFERLVFPSEIQEEMKQN